MGYGINAATNINIQKSINNIYQSDSNVCNAECNQIIQNPNVSIINSTAGNIGFTQSCQAQALCNIRNTLTATTIQTQFASQDATTSNSGTLFSCWGLMCINASTNISKQTVQNSNTQLISNVCSASVNQLISNATVFVSGSTVGNVEFDQSSQNGAIASCTITNVTTASVSQSQTNQQTASATSSNTVIIIVFIIAIVVVMLGLAYLNTQSRKTQQEEETKQVASLSEAVVAKSTAQAQITAATQAQESAATQTQAQELTGLSSFSQTPESSGDIELAAFSPSSTSSSSLSTTSSATASAATASSSTASTTASSFPSASPPERAFVPFAF